MIINICLFYYKLGMGIVGTKNMKHKPIKIEYKQDSVEDRLLWHRIKMMCQYKDRSLKEVVIKLLVDELFDNYPHF